MLYIVYIAWYKGLFEEILYYTNMSGNQLYYENVFRWFLSPWAKVFLTNETMSLYILFGTLNLVDLLRLLVSFCTRSGGLGTETLGMALLLYQNLDEVWTYHHLWWQIVVMVHHFVH